MEARSARTAKLGPAHPLQGAPSLSVNARRVPRVKTLGTWQVLLAAALLALLAGGTVMHKSFRGSHPQVAHAIRSHRFSHNGPSDLPLAAQGPASAALGSDGQAYRVRRWEGGFQASSPIQHLSASFTDSGVSVASGTTHLGLSLRAVGYGSSLTPLANVLPQAHANRVTYAHRSLSEWYANGPLGLEQGFTVVRAPAGYPAGPLTLSIALSANANAVLAFGGRSLNVDLGGKTILRYGGLTVSDARDHVLHSWLQKQGARLLIRVDSTGARYPLRVDPLIQQGKGLTVAESEFNEVHEFGSSVALSGNGNIGLVGGNVFDNGTIADLGAGWAFTRSNWSWNQPGQRLTTSGSSADLEYGSSVALSSSGDTALIGGWSHFGDDFGSVFTRSGSTWTQPGEQLVTGGQIYPERYGDSVALSGDGNTALIGGYTEGNMFVGAVWVFVRSGSTWTEQAKLTGGAEIGEGWFGASVALSGDGNTALIGGYRDNGGVGAAWVFTRSGSNWTQQGEKLTGARSGGEFGNSVALSSDGSTALVGESSANGDGAAWIFTRSGTTWTPRGERLTSSESETYSMFGWRVALSADGKTALVGSCGINLYGEAWVFTHQGSSWTTGEMLTGGGRVQEFSGCTSVALSGDGQTVLLGIGDLGYVAYPLTSEPAPPPPPGPPNATTGAATGITPTTAQLRGSVIPEAALTECYFQYGETSAYGSTVPCAQTVGAGASPVPVSASLTGLTPGTTYHVRLVATSSAGAGYGLDEVFTTAGSGPPAAATRIPLTAWSDTAFFEGEINAHGNAVEYGFEYGRSYVEEHFTGYVGTITGTSTRLASFVQHGLQPDVRYYVRVVGFYQGITFVRGATVSFEITPPEPEAAEAPYLEANGGDAEKGFVLRCNAGTWRNAAGFRYEWYGGSRLANTQEYGVTKSDIGHEVKCKVIPYQLNGQPDEAAALTTEPPYFPEGANDIVIPAWLKGLGSGLDVIHSGELGWEAGVACLALTDGACALLIGFDLERIVLTELILSVDDPPDRNYRDIAVPGSRSFSTMRRYPCARGLSHTTCAGLAHLAGRYAAAAARATSVIEAFAISRNRTLIARRKKDTQALLVQAAARKVYVGLLADAFVELNSAGLVYAEALHHARIDVRISVAASRRLANRPYTAVIGRSLLERMLRFATPTDIRHAIEAAGRHAAAFDLQKTLRRVLPTALLERYYATLDFNDLTSLINGLEGQRALSTTIGRRLSVDVAHARAACTLSGRKVAIEDFLRDAKSVIAASYYRLLVAAARPLSDGGSTVDPYSRCHT
jgi:FG-GAP repeat